MYQCDTVPLMTEKTSGQARTAAARAARRRQSEERKALALRERGWTCIPPEAGHGASDEEAVPGGERATGGE